jgi:hypothetical protein
MVDVGVSCVDATLEYVPMKAGYMKNVGTMRKNQHWEMLDIDHRYPDGFSHLIQIGSLTRN